MTEQTIPNTPQEVAAAVLDAIEREPGSFNMDTWFSLNGGESLTPDGNVCGTTMCAAGWAAHVTGWTLLKHCCEDYPNCGEHYGAMAEKDGELRTVEEVGEQALGLEWNETFWYATEDQAIQRLREIAGR